LAEEPRPPAPSGPSVQSSPPATAVPPSAPAPDDSIDEALQLLREVFEGIHEVYVEPVSVETLLAAALKGLHEQLDPHTKVLSEEEFLAVRSRQGAAVGIGITLAADGGRIRIRSVRQESPAERAGLMPGDLLLAVDGVAVRATNLEAAVDLLRGTLGSAVRLSVASPERTAREVVVQRETVTREALTERKLRGSNVGYLQIHRFARGVADRVEMTLTDWVLQEIEGVIIDLRDNPGGFIDEAARTADLLLPLGAQIVQTVGRLPEENGTLVSRRPPIAAHLPVVILVDSLTASSAEIFTGALKGQPGMIVLGEPTYGKRTVQRLVPMSNGGALKVTASVYCTPSDLSLGMGSLEPLGASASAEDRGAAPAERPRAGSLRGRGQRVEPDRRLEPLDPADPAVQLVTLGLLPRFSAESTLTAQERGEPGYWASSRPPAAGDGDSGTWIQDCQRARGFDRWCARLRSRLREWGWAGELPATPALRRAWFVDWTTERWGAEVGDQAALELDPWIQAAAESLAALRPPSEASARVAVTQPVAASPAARRGPEVRCPHPH